MELLNNRASTSAKIQYYNTTREQAKTRKAELEKKIQEIEAESEHQSEGLRSHELKLGEITSKIEMLQNQVTENEKKIEVKVTEREKDYRISVFNSGNPIPEESIPHLWEKFYKVDKARTREYGGSGIGLSIVKAIMDDLHKECGVENHTNGVEFYFDLDK